ncbi:hypothetical protein QR680_008739 [Steinernema hermaphroditum]|uniref:Uncharacterized protein n=1 Tax=Steinernema hermaphroditum TaxID=289476 RepID=A0AA39IJP3_9BILA|nr:hypothetical protein QR680_008739 [Steinernema hermaphroditum]
MFNVGNRRSKEEALESRAMIPIDPSTSASMERPSQPTARAMRRRALIAFRQNAVENATPISKMTDRMNIPTGDANEAKVGVKIFLKLTGEIGADRVHDDRTLFFNKTRPPLARSIVKQYVNYYCGSNVPADWTYVWVTFATFDYEIWGDAPVSLDEPIEEGAFYALTLYSPDYRHMDYVELPLERITIRR